MKDIVKRSFPVLKIYCSGCASSVEKIVKRLAGINDAFVDITTNILTVTFDVKRISPEIIRDALIAGGYGMIIDDDLDTERRNWKERNAQFKDLKLRLIGCAFFSMPIIILETFFSFMSFSDDLQLILCLPVLFYFGNSLFVNAWRQLGHGKCNIDTLVSLSASVAFLYSIFNTFFSEIWLNHGMMPHVYYEISVVIITFVLLSQMLEARIKRNNASIVLRLMELQPRKARILLNGIDEEVSIKEVMAGDHVFIRPGEKIPVDGIVIEGRTYVDEKMMNGGEELVLKEEGDHVLAATINRNSAITVLAQAAGTETVLARIIKTVKESQGGKKLGGKLIHRIIAYYVPTIIIIAILTFVLWILIGGINFFPYAVMSTISVLVIACPCALGLALPAALMIGVDEAIKRHIYIKDAHILEALRRIDAIVFDKAGILTEGRPEVSDMMRITEDEDDVSPILLAAAMKLETPISTAISVYMLKKGTIEPVSLVCFEIIPGKGVEAFTENKQFWLGNHKMLKDNDVKLTEEMIEYIMEYELSGNSLFYFGTGSTIYTIIAILDKVKLTSLKAITELNSKGIETFMLTTDGERTAQSVAGKLGIDVFLSDVQPNDKEEFIRECRLQGKRVAMVGDGVNDTQALALADIGIAMGRHPDIAMDVAAITLFTPDLLLLLRTFELSNRTIKLIKRNLFWAFIYNVIGVLLAAGVFIPIFGWILTPMAAALIMAFSSISVLISSLVAFKQD